MCLIMFTDMHRCNEYISIKLHIAHADFLSSDYRIRMAANNLNLVNSYQFSLGHSF